MRLCPPIAEGSAYDIASGAIRAIFRALDGYTPDAGVPVPDVALAHSLMLRQFEVGGGGEGWG